MFFAESMGVDAFFLIVATAPGDARMHEYAELLAGGEDAVTAAQHAFGDLDKLQQAFERVCGAARSLCTL